MTDRREEFDAPPDSEPPDAEEAFSLLSKSLRLDIIRVLWQAGRGNPVRFSELYDRVDVRGTSQFNYHLQQLVPHYVRKSEEGYRLTEAGERIVRAVNAGIYTEYTEMAGFDVRGPVTTVDLQRSAASTSVVGSVSTAGSATTASSTSASPERCHWADSIGVRYRLRSLGQDTGRTSQKRPLPGLQRADGTWPQQPDPGHARYGYPSGFRLQRV
ncbi:hypothetical protein SY89_03262 [Halolamina pelagica]|uniref:DUF7347 domain-containing protein n=1 Tax=Halolamina pelagica TaxID=699431 RepID=A0A0P7HXC5_9EURY|nr:hypothetical protein SY89_03262 [Halolamina pelagica]